MSETLRTRAQGVGGCVLSMAHTISKINPNQITPFICVIPLCEMPHTNRNRG